MVLDLPPPLALIVLEKYSSPPHVYARLGHTPNHLVLAWCLWYLYKVIIVSCLISVINLTDASATLPGPTKWVARTCWAIAVVRVTLQCHACCRMYLMRGFRRIVLILIVSNFVLIALCLQMNFINLPPHYLMFLLVFLF